MNKATEKIANRNHAINQLRKIVRPGDTLYTVPMHISRSGMMRVIKVIVNKDMWDVSSLVADAIGWGQDASRGGVKVTGCGMDMEYRLVYTLSQTLFPEYDCPGERTCASGDHMSMGTRERTRHVDGYALSKHSI